MKTMFLLTEYATDNFGGAYKTKIACSSKELAEQRSKEDRKASTEIWSTQIEEIEFYK